MFLRFFDGLIWQPKAHRRDCTQLPSMVVASFVIMFMVISMDMPEGEL